MKDQYVHISPRLSTALHMLNGYSVVADIGCDHGRLSAALLQKNICKKVIATDISEPSLKKAKDLINRIGQNDRVSFRAGDGCGVLKPYECDAVAMLGMGGTLMCRILESCKIPIMGAKALVLQPMRAQDDIREYLFRNMYHITEDQVVSDHGRMYQIFKAVPDDTFDQIPDGYPKDFFDVGYRSFLERDPLLPDLCRQQLSCHLKMLPSAVGSDGEARLMKKIKALETIISQFEHGGINDAK